MKLNSNENFKIENKYSTDEENIPAWTFDGGNDLSILWKSLLPVFEFLKRENITELVINKPHEIQIEVNGEWETHYIESYDRDMLYSIATRIAGYSQQKFDETKPTLSATLPTGDRVQICGYSTVLPGTISFTIRKPSRVVKTIDDYCLEKYFQDCIWVSNVDIDEILESDKLTKDQKKLCVALFEQRYDTFFKLAVQSRQNIILSGSTGSGKTTFMKSLVALVPQEERLLSVENVDELGLHKTHKNAVALFYSAGGQGVSDVGQKELLVCSLRMKPDRIFLAELLEGNEAFYYLRNVGSGHPGSITSMHATTALGAKEQLALFLKESEAGGTLTKQDIMGFLNTKVDIILQVNKIGSKRRMTQIDYDPLRPFKVNNNEIATAIEELAREHKTYVSTQVNFLRWFRRYLLICAKCINNFSKKNAQKIHNLLSK